MTKGKGRAILPASVALRVSPESELALATRLSAATKWMAVNGKTRCDGVDTGLAFGLAIQRQRKLEKEMK